MEDFEEVTITPDEVVGPSPNVLNVPKLLLALGLAESGVDAMRALAERAVTLDGEPSHITEKVPPLPARIVVQLGKRIKIAVIGAEIEGYKGTQRARPSRPLSGKASDLAGWPPPEPEKA